MNLINDVSDTISFLNGDESNVSRIYPMTNENIFALYHDINFTGKDVLSVAGSGDQAFFAYLKGANKVDIFDKNKITIYYYYLRLWVMKYLDSFYMYPYPCSYIISKLLDKVDVERDDEVIAFDFWNKVLNSVDANFFDSLFYGGATYFDMDYDQISELVEIHNNKKINFYNVDMATDVNLSKKYDIIVTSNIADWIRDFGGNMELYRDNLDKLLNVNGIVLCSNVLERCVNSYEKCIFEEKFTHHSLDGHFMKSPGYYYTRK